MTDTLGIMQDFDAVVSLVAGDDVELDGVLHCPGPDEGTALFADRGIEGFVWPYLRDGQEFAEPPALWLMLLGFRAPRQRLRQFQRLQSDFQFRISGDYDEVWPTRRKPLSNCIVALERQHPNRRLNAIFQSWRHEQAEFFVQLGGVDQRDPWVLASTAPRPHPLFWQQPRTPQNLFC